MINYAALEKEAYKLFKRIWKHLKNSGYSLTPENLNNPELVASMLGLSYEEHDSLGSYEEKGIKYEVAGLLDRQGKRILISRQFSINERRFTAFHEIAHWILHASKLEILHRDRPRDGTSEHHKSRIESEADYFASCLLIPPSQLEQEFKNLFGSPPLAFNEGLTLALGIDASDLDAKLRSSKSRLFKEKLIARARTINGQPVISLAEKFGVSPTTMAIRLKEKHFLEPAKFLTRQGKAQIKEANFSPQIQPTYNEWLPVTKKILSRMSSAPYTRLLAIQHCLRDTYILLHALRSAGITTETFVAKPTSIDASAKDAIMSLGITVIEEPPTTVPPYTYFEQTETLLQAIEKEASIAERENRKLAIIDVGGHFGPHIMRLNSRALRNIAGIVEVTTLGHTYYASQIERFPVPVVSIARSKLKQAEAKFVGETVVRATQDVLQENGDALTGKVCGVIGFGMIGSEIAAALQEKKVHTIVYDQSYQTMLTAKLKGFDVGSLYDLLKQCDVVFSATAQQSVNVADLRDAKHNQILVSGGSRAQEFDIKGIASSAIYEKRVSAHLTSFTFSNGRTSLVANDGKAINFLKDGTPEKIMDIVFAEITCGVAMLLERRLPLGKIHEVSDADREAIAKEFLLLESPMSENPIKH